MPRGVLTVLLIYCASALATDDLTPEQQRLRSCNSQAKAKGLSHKERSRFLTDCLNGRKGSRPLTPIQARNEACTKLADSRRLEGAERRGYMSNCTRPDRVKQETPHRVQEANCNHRAESRGLDGEERHKFVIGCLDGWASVNSGQRP